MIREVQDFFILERPSRTTPDQELVSRCLDGDESAWAALIDKYKDLVWSVPLKYRLSPEDAADIFQAVWVDLFSELKNLRNVEGLRAWLITTAGRKCYHWKARQNSTSRLRLGDMDWEPEDGSPSLMQIKLQVEREQLLRQAMSQLSPRCRELVNMLFFEQPPRPYQEIAKTLDLAVGSIGFIRGRCLKKLRQMLTEQNF